MSSNIKIKNETFKSLTIDQQKNIIQQCEKVLGNDYTFNIDAPLSDGGFRFTDGVNTMEISEETLLDFAVLTIDDVFQDNYIYWVDSWNDHNEVEWLIELLTMCEAVAVQRFPNKTNAIPPEVKHQHQKGPNMHDHAGFPPIPQELY